MSQSLEDLINIEHVDHCYDEALDVVAKLRENVDSTLQRLLAFKESWTCQEVLANRLEQWMSFAERELDSIQNHANGHMRQFWVGSKLVKVNALFFVEQFEVYI